MPLTGFWRVPEGLSYLNKVPTQKVWVWHTIKGGQQGAGRPGHQTSYHPPLATPRHRTTLELWTPHHAARPQSPGGSLVELEKGVCVCSRWRAREGKRLVW